MPREFYATQNSAAEWAFRSEQVYLDPFNEIELDVVFTHENGKTLKVPAFWAGEQEWRVRFAAPEPGEWTWRTACTDTESDLHDQEGPLHVRVYEGKNPLIEHGPIRVADDKRHFEFADGTPFFWLGDTWWMSLTSRLAWPDDFKMLASDRVAKGFSVIQLVAGLYPDMPPFDLRGENEAGQSWELDWLQINPGYYDVADLKIQWLVRLGLVPCIVGCWGYYLPILGIEKMKKHWRNLVARYGAYPVFWCLAGEGTMPFYLSETREKDESVQKHGWAEVGRYVREIDPHRRPITIHPSNNARDSVDDDSVLDFDMLQTGHGGRDDLPNTVKTLQKELARTPKMPVVNGEVSYEGILAGSREEIQRLMFWACMLGGEAGHTYGADGIWQVNDIDRPYGNSPWGGAWGTRPWQEAMNLPGSTQVGVGRRILEEFDWWRFEPHQEWVEPHSGEEEYMAPFAAGIEDEVRIFYLPRFLPPGTNLPVVKDLGKIKWRAYFCNPMNGRKIHIGAVEKNDAGDWKIPLPPVMHDWLLILDREKADVVPPGAIMYA